MEKLNVAIADDNERMLQALGDIVKSIRNDKKKGTGCGFAGYCNAEIRRADSYGQDKK